MKSLRRLIFTVLLCSPVVGVLASGCGSAETQHPPPAGNPEASTFDSTVFDTQRPDTTPPPIDTGMDSSREATSDAPSDAPSDTALQGECGTSCCDGIKDGTETDIDCGGLTCPACADGKLCSIGSDCQSLDCSGGPPTRCVAATCMDGIRNEGETDIDCGGPNCPKCIVGKQCQGMLDCVSNLCNMNVCSCPAGMVIFPTALPTGGDYCIDSLEVTLKDYEAFWTANPVPMNQPAFCSWNMSYTPGGDWPPDLITNDPGYNGGYPVNYVNWCDAYAYCAWAGKRLCGNIAGGPNGGANPLASENDHLNSQWFNACSAEGVQTYPYSGGYQPCRCNGTDFWTTTCMATAGTPGTYAELNSADMLVDVACQGGASNLFQMSGNVAEWENSCDNFTSGSAGAGDNCLARGGSYASASSVPVDGGALLPLACAADPTELMPRNTELPTIGFRCCL